MSDLELIFLMDNNQHPLIANLEVEHGLSIFFEADHKKWMYDVGNSNRFVNNATILGHPIDQVESLILSHGHHDHTGGLAAFLEQNQRGTITTAHSIFQNQYYSLRHGGRRETSVDASLYAEHPERFNLIHDNVWLTPNVGLFFNKSDKYPKPKANSMLEISSRGQEDYRLDDFNHELSVAVRTPQGLVVLSACSHNGVLNILDSACQFAETNHVVAFVGGMHLIDGDYEKKDEVKQMGEQLLNLYPDLTLYTGHCTGQEAITHLSKVMGDKLQQFYCGFNLSFKMREL